MTYTPPINDILFVLTRLIGIEKLAALPGYDSVSDDLTRSILEEAGKLASGTFAPLNHEGDKQGLKFSNNSVTMPTGFADAYKEYVAGGWNGLSFPESIGGQGLPATLAMPVQEMLQTANLALALCTLLNQGAIELLSQHGTEAQKQKYLPNMVSGAWTGTMNLTESSAGSDVGAVRCKAIKDGAHYKVQGQKIFISYGEHDMAENIIHLVLARLPGAPEGTKGLSLFLVPKFLVKDDGTLGARNDAYAISIEHKLGQHASPTCTMSYGDKENCYAELVGEENRGIEAMFVMMNNARIGVGLQGLALCERAMQHAADFARSRVQSKPLKTNAQKGADKPVTIINHPDVRRMLMSMKAQIEASRALAYSAAFAIDSEHQERVDLLTPIVKAWITDLSNELTSTGVQVFGGMGFIEETGAAQHMRDARVLAIYEGTNGIQANDLVFRKLSKDDAKAFNAYVAEMHVIAKQCAAEQGDDMAVIAATLLTSLGHLEKAAAYLLHLTKSDMNAAAFAAVPFLRLFAVTAGAARMAEAALISTRELQAPQDFSADFLESKIITARFYAESILPQTAGLLPVILAKQQGVITMPESWF
ncbi:MAG: acyl-CoA dehydrogenase [Alphaproteobacteria bacterium]|nr:acyl-CoA dehydrogenase [Alphaproteobacteria bacterium]